MEIFTSPDLREIERPVEIVLHRLGGFGAVEEQVAEPVRPAPLSRFPERGIYRGVDRIAQLRVIRKITVDATHCQVAAGFRPYVLLEMNLPAYSRFVAEHPARHAFRNNRLFGIGEAIFVPLDKREPEHIHDNRVAGRHLLAKTFCVASFANREVVPFVIRGDHRPGLDMGRGGDQHVGESPRVDHTTVRHHAVAEFG